MSLASVVPDWVSGGVEIPPEWTVSFGDAVALRADLARGDDMLVTETGGVAPTHRRVPPGDEA
jgi:hypothetical protein